MNSVTATGQVVERPELETGESGGQECELHLAVPRYSRSGIREPGVVYVKVMTFGLEAEGAANLKVGEMVGFSGRLENDGRIHPHQLDLRLARKGAGE